MATLNELTSGTSGGYPDRVASLGMTSDVSADLVKQLIDLQKQQNQLRVDKEAVPNVGDHLKSLPGILAMLGGGAATVAGAPDIGTALVGGFAKGAMGAGEAQKAKIAEEQARTDAIIEAQRTRLTTLLQSRPEMFLDPKTGESLIDPRLIGYAATGTMMPINPAVNYQLTKQTESQRTRVDMGLNLMMNGDTAEKRRQGAIIMDTALGLKLQPEFYEGIMGQDEKTAWAQIFANQDLDITQSLQARVYALTNNKSLDDPEVVGMLRRAPLGTGTDGLTMDKYTLSLVAKFNQAMSQAGEEIHNLPVEDQIDYVFKGATTGDAAVLKKFFMGQDVFGTGVSGSTIANLGYQNASLMAMIFKMTPTDPMFVDAGITSESQIWEKSFDTIGGAVGNIKRAQEDATTQNFGLKLQSMAAEMVRRGEAATLQEASDKAVVLLKQYREDSTTVDNKFDIRIFNEKYKQYINGGK